MAERSADLAMPDGQGPDISTGPVYRSASRLREHADGCEGPPCPERQGTRLRSIVASNSANGQAAIWHWHGKPVLRSTVALAEGLP